jgi:hypothetical protein
LVAEEAVLELVQVRQQDLLAVQLPLVSQEMEPMQPQIQAEVAQVVQAKALLSLVVMVVQA